MSFGSFPFIHTLTISGFTVLSRFLYLSTYIVSRSVSSSSSNLASLNLWICSLTTALFCVLTSIYWSCEACLAETHRCGTLHLHRHRSLWQNDNRWLRRRFLVWHVPRPNDSDSFKTFHLRYYLRLTEVDNIGGKISVPCKKNVFNLKMLSLHGQSHTLWINHDQSRCRWVDATVYLLNWMLTQWFTGLTDWLRLLNGRTLYRVWTFSALTVVRLLRNGSFVLLVAE